mgnify:FL=1
MSQPEYGERQLFIGGELRGAEQGLEYDNISPVTEQVIGVAADASLADAEAALAAARKAFDESDWATDPQLRVKCLRQFVEGMNKHIDDLRAATAAETGATQFFVNGPQCDGPVAMASWPIDYLEQFQWEREIGEAEVMGIKSRRVVRKEAALSLIHI